MKRSFINEMQRWSLDLLATNSFKLPMFGYWKLDEWKEKKDEIERIKKTMLGWDVTDFGGGDFDSVGAVLFTIRNGNVHEQGCGTPYAEKVILMKQGQKLPLHFHFNKMEDIINRGGGVLVIELYKSKEDGSVDYESDVEIYCDGIKRIVKAGNGVEILPGNSMTLTPYIYHNFIAKEGAGDIIVGEVSKINDDNTDNRFAQEEASRFSEIEEDEEILYPLCNEYDKVL